MSRKRWSKIFIGRHRFELKILTIKIFIFPVEHCTLQGGEQYEENLSIFNDIFGCLVFDGDIAISADGFTQKDRELLIELKMKMAEIDRRFEQVDKRGDEIERRLERLESVMMWGFGLLFSSMLGLFSVVLWDRKTLSPAIRKSRELEDREELVEKALKEYAKIEPRFAEILKILRM